MHEQMKEAKHEHVFVRSDKDCRPDLLVMTCECGEVRTHKLPAPAPVVKPDPRPVIIPQPEERSPPYQPLFPTRPSRPYWDPYIRWCGTNGASTPEHLRGLLRACAYLSSSVAVS